MSTDDLKNAQRILQESEMLARYLRRQEPDWQDVLPPARRAAVLQFPHGYSRLAAFLAKQIVEEIFALALEQTAGDPIRFERQLARIEKCKAEMEQLSQRARQKRPARRSRSGGK
jgi:hypothetical protein